MADDDERPSQPRLFVAQTHETLGRVARGISWLWDWIGTVAIAVVMLLVLGLAGAIWLPITGTVLDFLLWIAIVALGTAGLAVLVWRERRRRHGGKPSSDIATRFDAVSIVTSTWLGLGLLALIVGWWSDEGLNATTIFLGLLGLVSLVLAGMLVRRFIKNE